MQTSILKTFLKSTQCNKKTYNTCNTTTDRIPKHRCYYPFF